MNLTTKSNRRSASIVYVYPIACRLCTASWRSQLSPTLPGICLALLLSACTGSESIAPSSAPSGPLTLPAQMNTVAPQPSMAFDGVTAEFQNDAAPHLITTVLPDPGAEGASSAGLINQSDNLDGMSVSGDCRYSNTDVAASQGKWKFNLGASCSIVQISDSVVQKNRAIVLEFDVQNTHDLPSQTRAEIVAIDSDGTTAVIRSRDVKFAAGDTGWVTKQISVGFDSEAGSNPFNQLVGQALAVRFTNESTANGISLDSISLKTFSNVTEDKLIFNDSWDEHCDQQWAGQYFWSNRLQDWEVRDKRLQTVDPSRYRPNRTTHRMSTQMLSTPVDFSLSVDTGPVESTSVGSYSGFLIGAGARMDYRSAALIHNRHGRNGGLIAGIDEDGTTFILDNGLHKKRLAQSTSPSEYTALSTTLQLDGQFLENGLYRLNLFALDVERGVVSSTSVDIDSARLLGNIAIVSNPGDGNTAHWFDNWKGAGSKLYERASRQFGPVLFSSYTVDRKVLTVNAQYPPYALTTSLHRLYRFFAKAIGQQ